MKSVKQYTLITFLLLISLSMQASHVLRLQGAALGSLIGAAIGYNSYSREKEAHNDNPDLNKAPKKWYYYVLKSSAIGAVCGWGLVESSIFYSRIKEKIKVQLSEDRQRIEQKKLVKNAQMQLSPEQIELLKDIYPQFDESKVVDGKISPFDFLGVDKNASTIEVDRARRKHALKFHPDKTHNEQHSNDLMCLLNIAHQNAKTITEYTDEHGWVEN